MKKLIYVCVLLLLTLSVGLFVSCKRGDDTPSTNDGQQGGDIIQDGTQGGDNNPDESEPQNVDYYVTKELDTKFMSFNLKNNGVIGEREEAIIDFLFVQNPSVVCLQEIHEKVKISFVNSFSEKYEIVWKSLRSGTAEGLAILYDKEVWNLLGEERFWLSETPNVKSKGWGGGYRICMSLLLEHKETGIKMMVFNAQLDSNESLARENGMKLIMSKIEECGYPAFLGIDLNDTNNSAAYALTKGILQDCQQTAAETDTGVTNHADGAIADQDGVATDFCFVSKADFTSNNFKICRDKYGENYDQYLSDHYALETSFTFIYRISGNYPDSTDDGFDGYIEIVN